MKNLKFITWSFLATLLAIFSVACSPQGEGLSANIPIPPDSTVVKVTITPNKDTANIVTFSNSSTVPGIEVWQIDGVQTTDQKSITKTYPFAGTYTVRLTLLTATGATSNTFTVTIAKTDVDLLKVYPYLQLTGGVSETGRTWVMDAGVWGHLGVGQPGGTWPNWWAANPYDKTGVGLYDDEMTYIMSQTVGLSFVYNNHGDTYSNWEYATDLVPNAVINGQTDPTLNYTPQTNMKWSLDQSNGNWYINLPPKAGFMGYYVGSSRYQIISVTDTSLYVVAASPNGNLWYSKFKVKQ